MEFENAEIAREAMESRQKYHIGTRYIEVRKRLLVLRKPTLTSQSTLFSYIRIIINLSIVAL